MAALAVKAVPAVIGGLFRKKITGKSGPVMIPGGPGGSVGIGGVIGSAAASAAAGAVANRVVNGKPDVPPEKPVAPLPDEEETRRSTRRRAALRFGRLGSGRASTVLDTSNTLGGG